MEVKAKAKYIRRSPKKVRLVVDIIRGLDVSTAENQLKFMNKGAVEPILKLLNSVVANAEHNFELKKDNLYIKEIRVDQGPTLKRWMPRAMGRATTIRKRSSHISVVLSEKVPSNLDKKNNQIKLSKKEKETGKTETKNKKEENAKRKNIKKVNKKETNLSTQTGKNNNKNLKKNKFKK